MVSAAAAASTVEYTSTEQSILSQIRQLGGALPDNQPEKFVITCLKEISFVNPERTILKLDFSGGGATRFHKLSDELQSRIQSAAYDSIQAAVPASIQHSDSELINETSFADSLSKLSLNLSESTVPASRETPLAGSDELGTSESKAPAGIAAIQAISQEVVNDLKKKQWNIQGPYAEQVFKRLQTPDAEVQALIASNTIVDVFSITAAEFVIVYQDPDCFDRQAIIKTLLSHLDIKPNENQQLLKTFISLIAFHVDSETLVLELAIPQDKISEVREAHKEIHKRLQQPETGMAEDLLALQDFSHHQVINGQPIKILLFPLLQTILQNPEFGVYVNTPS